MSPGLRLAFVTSGSDRRRYVTRQTEAVRVLSANEKHVSRVRTKAFYDVVFVPYVVRRYNPTLQTAAAYIQQ